jgi:hypothetical protein
MTPVEISARLRLLADEMKLLGGEMVSAWRFDKEFSIKGTELLTAAYVAGFWADGIDAKVGAGGTAA